MPNGRSLPEDTFDKLESPLKGIDGVLLGFADEVGASIEANYHDEPSRRLWVTSNDGLVRLIHISPIYLHKEAPESIRDVPYIVGLLVWRDRDGERWIWNERFNEVRLGEPAIRRDFAQELRGAWKRLSAFNDDDLARNGERSPLG